MNGLLYDNRDPILWPTVGVSLYSIKNFSVRTCIVTKGRKYVSMEKVEHRCLGGKDDKEGLISGSGFSRILIVLDNTYCSLHYCPK